MNVLTEYLLPFVKPGGICICMKGPNLSEEICNARRAINLLGGEVVEQINIKLDGGNIDRNLVVIKKIKHTTEEYPRKPGTPAKQPL